MSDTSTPTPEAATPKKGSKKFLIIIVLAVLLAGGGGGGYYFWRASSASAAESETSEKKGSKKPKKGAESADDEHDAEKPEKAADSALPDDEDVKAIVELPPFIINLADTEQARYLRMTVSLGVAGGEGGEEEKPDQLFMTRVRNAMLAVLSEKKSDDVLTAEGKAKLRKELLKAAQAASEEPHVQAIYITDFIVQM